MKLILFFAISLFLLACKKSEDRTCAKTAGEDAELELLLDPFNSLELNPNVRYILVQDTVEKVIVRGGGNLINLISATVDDQKLSIKNGNKCNFLRSYKHEVEVEIHLINIINVLFKGTKELSCKNQLNLPYLTFVVDEGAGTCNLNLKCTSLYLGSRLGWGNFNVSGKTNYLRIVMYGNGFGDLYNFQIIDSATVISESSERLKINLDDALIRAETSSNGDIWYIGTPSFLEYNRYGEGELIDKN